MLLRQTGILFSKSHNMIPADSQVKLKLALQNYSCVFICKITLYCSLILGFKVVCLSASVSLTSFPLSFC